MKNFKRENLYRFDGVDYLFDHIPNYDQVFPDIEDENQEKPMEVESVDEYIVCADNIKIPSYRFNWVNERKIVRKNELEDEQEY